MNSQGSSNALDNIFPAELKAAHDIFVENTKLPDGLRNKLPWGVENKFVRGLFDKVLPALRLGSVRRERIEQDGRTFYCITMYVPGRRIEMVITPVHAYYVASMLTYLKQHDALKKSVQFENEHSGSIYIPLWAAKGVVGECVAIIRAHEEHIDFVVESIQRAVFLGTKRQHEEEAIQSVPLHGDGKDTPTIH